MKNFKIAEVLLLILTLTVCTAILVSIIGIVIKGAGNPSPESSEIRKQLINLLNIMVGVISGSIGTILAYNLKNKGEVKEEPKDQIQSS